MSDPILVPESVVSCFEERARGREKIATQFIRWCSLTTAILMIGYAILVLVTGFELGEPNLHRGLRQ